MSVKGGRERGGREQRDGGYSLLFLAHSERRAVTIWWKRAFVAFLFLAVTAPTALFAQTLTTLVNFDIANGSEPMAPLVKGRDGNLYGTTVGGGVGGSGTVFKITPAGILTTLYVFNGNNGFGPYGGLVQAADGNFYGTTYISGTVFEMTPQGVLTTLYYFNNGYGSDFGPTGSLVQATDGNFYGIGANDDDGGTLFMFKITPGGTLTALHSFSLADGIPSAGLIQGTDGDFYGTTFLGGPNGGGTVFKITPGGTLTTLHGFKSVDGSSPAGALIQGTDGNFYGTTSLGGAGGAYTAFGTVFKITPQGTLTTLHNFSGLDGGAP
jgi:uncharacterized repeat protein (TIGR03803 family)